MPYEAPFWLGTMYPAHLSSLKWRSLCSLSCSDESSASKPQDIPWLTGDVQVSFSEAPWSCWDRARYCWDTCIAAWLVSNKHGAKAAVLEVFLPVIIAWLAFYCGTAASLLWLLWGFWSFLVVVMLQLKLSPIAGWQKAQRQTLVSLSHRHTDNMHVYQRAHTHKHTAESLAGGNGKAYDIGKT